MTYKAYSGPDGTSIYLIYNCLQGVTANRFSIRANFYRDSGYSG